MIAAGSYLVSGQIPLNGDGGGTATESPNADRKVNQLALILILGESDGLFCLVFLSSLLSLRWEHDNGARMFLESPSARPFVACHQPHWTANVINVSRPD